MNSEKRHDGAKNPSRRRPNRDGQSHSFDLAALVMDIVARGLKAFVDEGECHTHAVVIDRHGRPALRVPQCLPDDNVKSCFASVVAETANEVHAVAVVFLTEAWVSGERPSWPPSRSARKQGSSSGRFYATARMFTLESASS